MNEQRKVLFDSLYTQFHGMVYQMCMGFMKGDAAPASDLAQETFINVWIALPNFRGESSHKTWIYRIAVNTCLQYLRKEKVRQRTDQEQAEQHSTVEINHEDPHQNLYRAIGQLGEVDRLIITMVLEELEYEEIAKVVGIEENNLRVRIHRIKKKLKETLEHEQRI